PRQPHRVAHRLDGFVLADDAMMQFLFELDQPLALFGVSSVTGMPVSFETTWAMCSVRTSADAEPRLRFQRSVDCCNSFSFASCWDCRSDARSNCLREVE